MSRIHDALRKAERQQSLDHDPAIDILADSAAAQVFPDIGKPSDGKPSNGDKAASKAQADPARYSAVGIESIPEMPETKIGDLSEGETAPLFPEFLDGQFHQSSWAAPDPDALLFVQPENIHEIEREQFRTLRSRLYQLRINRPVKTVLVSSALPAEGKTFVSANLGMAMVLQHGRRILLVDADLRKSDLHQFLGAPPTPGLTEYLAGEADEMAIIQKAPISNLCFIPAGKAVSNTGELIGNGRLAKLIERVAPLFDWIILDSPPAVPISDASLIAEACDGVILVVKASSTPFDVARKACTEFRRKPILGVILNHTGKSLMCGAYYDQHYVKQKVTSKDES
jgi:protein-tyrosine kinase